MSGKRDSVYRMYWVKVNTSDCSGRIAFSECPLLLNRNSIATSEQLSVLRDPEAFRQVNTKDNVAWLIFSRTYGGSECSDQ